jgi:hypothetical protein
VTLRPATEYPCEPATAAFVKGEEDMMASMMAAPLVERLEVMISQGRRVA